MEENQTPQNIEKYHEHYSESKLFEKIKKVVIDPNYTPTEQDLA